MNAEISRAVRAARKPLREQRDAWKLAAFVLFIISISINLFSFYFIFNQDEKISRKDSEILELKQENLRIKSLLQLAHEDAKDITDIYISKLKEERALRKQAEAYEAVGAYRYIGECTVTAYCPCEQCCGQWADGLTATGIPAGPGIVAVDPDIIPLGSTVIIDGHRYLAADTGSSVKGQHIDICMTSHRDATEFGTQSAEVWVVENG